MSKDVGIDYSNGKSNFDPANGIHFGILPMNRVLQAWCDSSEPYYGEDDPDESESEIDIEPLEYQYKQDGYDIFSDDNGDLMVLKSPYYTTCKYCSPCAPGAGDLLAYSSDGIKAYCLGADWFDDESEIPYKIHKVQV